MTITSYDYFRQRTTTDDEQRLHMTGNDEKQRRRTANDCASLELRRLSVSDEKRRWTSNNEGLGTTAHDRERRQGKTARDTQRRRQNNDDGDSYDDIRPRTITCDYVRLWSLLGGGERRATSKLATKLSAT